MRSIELQQRRRFRLWFDRDQICPQEPRADHHQNRSTQGRSSISQVQALRG